MESILVIVGLVVVFVVILIINATRLKPSKVTDPLPPAEVFGDKKAVKRFRAMLRCKTVWPGDDPKADYSAFDEFLPTLKKLYPRVFDTLELTQINKYGIMLRWPGADPGAAPVVLMAHYDVVHAKPNDWKHDPFGAEIHDGRIYARGAVDTKCILAALLESIDHLLAKQHTPPRDVYLCSSNSEEDMGLTGNQLASYFSKKDITPCFVLDEGGAVIDNAPLGVPCELAAIGVAEKGFITAYCAVDSQGGHAATPASTDAPAKLVAALANVLKIPSPAKLSKPVEAMLKELAAHGGLGLKLVFGNLWIFRPLVLKIMKSKPETAAMVRTTYALTELQGSKSHNVIPKTAKATINVRVDPHETVKAAMKRLESGFAKAGIAIKDTHIVLKTPIDPSPVSPFKDEVFDYLRTVTQSVYPNAAIAPYVQSSCADARHFSLICPHTYRFAGFLFKEEQRSSIHGVDENLDVESYKRGVGFYIQLISHLDRLGGRP
ncbi:MAG: M20/M25/M40 family metallo-hydrolase [Coriobacteriia bacterium]|nr:M20/M25/M40 family metallo-hydrolase [Coriobacteriia bacterium]